MNKTIRKTVKTRANYLCEYCLSSEYFSPDPFAKLRLNRPSVVNLRMILIQLGELPFDILPL
jgi:hypothetical protein